MLGKRRLRGLSWDWKSRGLGLLIRECKSLWFLMVTIAIANNRCPQCHKRLGQSAIAVHAPR